MQLILDTDPPTLVRLSVNPHTGERGLELHRQNENGTLTMTALVVLGAEDHPGDLVAVGQIVVAALS